MARKNPHAVALGRKGRKVNSPAQQAAARANGRKGGRPRTVLSPCGCSSTSPYVCDKHRQP